MLTRGCVYTVGVQSECNGVTAECVDTHWGWCEKHQLDCLQDSAAMHRCKQDHSAEMQGCHLQECWTAGQGEAEVLGGAGVWG